MKKVSKALESVVYGFIGSEAIQGRSTFFKALVGVLVLVVTVFISYNILQLVL